MVKKVTLTIGIPAYNEEVNIKDLLLSVVAQKADSFTLEKILVVSDGSNDNTVKIAREVKDKRIFLVEDGKRLGKAARLNQIYKANKSDFLATFDADVLLGTENQLETLLKEATKNEKINVVAGRIVMSKPTYGLTAKMLYFNHKFWDKTVENYKNGVNIHTSHGSAYLLRGSFIKEFRFPDKITCDQGFLFMSAKNHGYSFAKSSMIRNNPTTNFKETRIGASRMFSERNDLVSHFGKEVLSEYIVPSKFKLEGLVSVSLENPIYAVCAVIYNLLIPFMQIPDKKRKNGLWSISKSTKQRIIFN